MKNILGFLGWQYRRMELWQKTYIVGAFFFGLGMGLEQPYKQWAMMVPIALVLVWMLKWAVWDATRRSWAKYKEERQTLFDTIKDSHK